MLRRATKPLGYSQSEFRLRMTREEIGNPLGLKLETISRLLSYLAQLPQLATLFGDGGAM